MTYDPNGGPGLAEVGGFAHADHGVGVLQEGGPHGAAVHGVDRDLRIVLPTVNGYRGNGPGRGPAMPTVAAALYKEVDIAGGAGAAARDVVVLVQDVLMAKPVGGDGRFPVVAGDETDPVLEAEPHAPLVAGQSSDACPWRQSRHHDHARCHERQRPRRCSPHPRRRLTGGRPSVNAGRPEGNSGGIAW